MSSTKGLPAEEMQLDDVMASLAAGEITAEEANKIQKIIRIRDRGLRFRNAPAKSATVKNDDLPPEAA